METGKALYQAARSILLVEDSQVEAELLRRTLASGGYRVTVTHDGEQALAAIRAERPDLVMSDIRMPCMDGYELCRAIKKDPKLCHIPVILLSVLSEPDDIIEAINAGADSYTTKPYTESSLLGRLNSLLAAPTRAPHKPGEPLEVEYRGQLHHINTDPQQMLNLLLSVYENTLVQNRELMAIQAQLSLLNESLEAKVRERTAALEANIAELKAAEAAISRLNAELEKRVEMRTAELQAANSDLENFASAVSHDLRAPLRAMHGLSAIVIEDYGERLQGEGIECLREIQRSASRMGELIDGLLALAHHTRGEMHHDAVDLSALARRILAELRRADPEHRAEVEIDAGLAAWGDPRMLEVLLTNLLGNAWKYTRHTDNPRIRFYTETGEKGPRYCIADNGAGFDMAYAGRLFQPFQRLHRQDEFPGIGMGLATVKRIVERHGGTIQARGKTGEGAIFCFDLPAGGSES